MRTTNAMLNNKITYANETLNTNFVNRVYNGYNHLTLNTENVFAGNNRECIDFLAGLIQFQLLNQ